MIKESISFFTENLDVITEWGWKVVKIIALFILIRMAMTITNKVFKRVLEVQGKMNIRRQQTLESLISNLLRTVSYSIFILTILPMFGIEIAALLAGAGVAGIAIAFGAQSLLKDFFNGFFILFEDQYGVGDYVIINGEWGQVREITLRLTVLKYWTGQVIYIPNGEIKQVINYSQENSIADIHIEVGYNTDTDTAIKLIDKVIHEAKETDEDIVGEIGMMGIESLNQSTYTVRCYVECNPYTHWGVRRRIKERVQKEFMRNGIDLPIQKISYMYKGPHEANNHKPPHF